MFCEGVPPAFLPHTLPSPLLPLLPSLLPFSPFSPSRLPFFFCELFLKKKFNAE